MNEFIIANVSDINLDSQSQLQYCRSVYDTTNTPYVIGAPLVERPIVLWRETQKYFIAQILEILRKQTRPVKKSITIFNF